MCRLQPDERFVQDSGPQVTHLRLQVACAPELRRLPYEVMNALV